MKTLLCATGNVDKFGIGKTIFAKHGIELEQIVIDIDEIQGEDPETIIRDKAKRAFEQIGKPVVVSDDSWSIPALNGFPGAYMKSINHWFKPADFIRLMKGITDRRIYINQYVAYIDENEIVVFSIDVLGEISLKPAGKYGPPIMKVTAMDADDGLTISQVYDNNLQHTPGRLTDRSDAWNELAKWYAKKIAV